MENYYAEVNSFWITIWESTNLENRGRMYIVKPLRYFCNYVQPNAGSILKLVNIAKSWNRVRLMYMSPLSCSKCSKHFYTDPAQLKQICSIILCPLFHLSCVQRDFRTVFNKCVFRTFMKYFVQVSTVTSFTQYAYIPSHLHPLVLLSEQHFRVDSVSTLQRA